MRKIIVILLSVMLMATFTSCNLISDKEEEVSIEAAEDLIDDGEIDDAVDMLENLLDDDEEDWEAWELLVQAFIEDEEFEDAADALEDMGKAIEDNYEADDEDIEDAIDVYNDLADEIMDEDEDIEFASLNLGDREEQEAIEEPEEPEEPEEEVTPDIEPETDTVSSGAGRPDVDLELDQMYFTFFEDGRLSMATYATSEDIEADFMADFSGSEAEIKEQIETSLNESIGMFGLLLGLDISLEVADIEKMGDQVYIELVFSDFEIAYMDLWYDSIEGFTDVNGEISFLSYSNNMPMNGFGNYNHIFIARLEGENGTYYEFPGEIQFVEEYVDFERISDSVIYMEPNTTGYVGVDAAIEGEMIDVFDDWSNVDDNPEVGDPNNLQVGQSRVIYNLDGSYEKTVHIKSDDFEWDYEGVFSQNPDEIVAAVQTYYHDWYGIDVNVRDVNLSADSVMFTIILEYAADIDYYYGETLEYEVDWYGSYEDYAEGNTYMYYDTGMMMDDPMELEQFKEYNIIFADTYDEATYYVLPGNIAVIDGDLTFDYVDENTIYVHSWDYGIIIYQP